MPTWNYIAVHARGIFRLIEDEQWLRQHLTRLTEDQEGQRKHPWAITDAPPAYVTGQLRGIVGLEMEVTELEGKWKLSQNRTQVDRQSLIVGLASSDDIAERQMSALIAAESIS